MNKLTITLLSIAFLVSCNSQIKDRPSPETASSISLLAEQKLLDTNIEAVNNWLVENKKSEDFEVNEAAINRLGYELLYDANKPEEAIKVFEINIELYPKSSNVYDSAAEGYLIAGDYDKSIKYYRKAIDKGDRVLFHQIGYLEPEPYQPTVLSNDIKKLFEYEGNWENEMAFVYVQGGPDLGLYMGPRDGLHLMPDEENLLKIYPYQAQMLNSNIVSCKPLITAEQSAFENGRSVEILDRVIKHLVDNNKKVFLIGHSYGASISMEYVHSKENLAHKVVLMGLDLDEDISSWETLKPGEYIRWENGQKPYARTIFRNIPNDHPLKPSFDRVADNLTMIVKNNMAKRYTDLYKEEDFKNIISVYSNQDEANGKKSQEELAILNQKGTTVVEIEGDHHDMLTREFMTDLYNHLVNNQPLNEKY